MSKIEIEAKVLEIDKLNVMHALDNLGAECIFNDKLEAIYYYKEGVINTNNALRLRREGNEVTFTYKEKSSSSTLAKSFIEKELKVESFETMDSIIQSLGFEVYEKNSKHRISYKLPGVRFEIDEYFDSETTIPIFLELEVAEESLIKTYIEKLNLGKSKIVNYNYFELKKYYENN